MSSLSATLRSEWCNALNASSALFAPSSPIKLRPLTASPLASCVFFLSLPVRVRLPPHFRCVAACATLLLHARLLLLLLLLRLLPTPLLVLAPLLLLLLWLLPTPLLLLLLLATAL
jgi:hypothetical protein